ncbi:hypothetical protein [Anaerovibrio sp.]|uniref:hypothetical protein n=1 Tax=Anaerovibrio sp. TaxID=1872532 RepID=UPI003F135322
MNVWKIWVYRWLIVNIFLLSGFFLASGLILGEFRELYSDDEILSESDDILLGSAITESSLIKFKIVEQKKPKVVAIGSSRVMQFRSNYFIDKDFFTMGGTAGSLMDADKTFKKIKKSYTPDVVILGVDLWWLNPNFSHVSTLGCLDEIRESKYKKYFQLIKFMKDNAEMRGMLFHLDDIKERDAVGGRRTVGLSAAVKSDGYRLADGSYQYGHFLTADFKTAAELFQDTHKRLDDRNRRFEAADDIDYREFERLKSLVREMTKAGCHVIVFLPPFPDEIYSRMSSNDEWRFFLANFENSVKECCAEEKVQFFDFSNVLWVGSNDDECLDGFHGSEMTYTKIVKAMLADKVFAEYVNSDYLNYVLEHPANRFQAIPPNE